MRICVQPPSMGDRDLVAIVNSIQQFLTEKRSRLVRGYRHQQQPAGTFHSPAMSLQISVQQLFASVIKYRNSEGDRRATADQTADSGLF